MLAGEPPFTGPTAQAIIAKRFSGEVPRRAAGAAERAGGTWTQAIRQGARAGGGRPVRHRSAVRPGARHGADRHSAGARRHPVPAAPRRPAADGAGRPRSTPAPARRSHARARLPDRAGRALRLAPAHRRGGRQRAAPSGSPCSPSRTWATRPTPTSPTGSPTRSAASSPRPGLAVIARGSSNEYRKTTKTPQEIARELGRTTCSRPGALGEERRRHRAGCG